MTQRTSGAQGRADEAVQKNYKLQRAVFGSTDYDFWAQKSHKQAASKEATYLRQNIKKYDLNRIMPKVVFTKGYWFMAQQKNTSNSRWSLVLHPRRIFSSKLQSPT